MSWLARILGRLAPPRPLAERGFPPAAIAAPRLDALSDDDLARLNALLPWNCFTVDRRGRRFGDRAWSGKREEPQVIPDRRIVLFDERSGLGSAHVLEIGCFEGVHTIALCQRAARVTAVDGRIENVVKTVVRASLYGFRPEVFVCDVDDARATATLPEVDLVHHVGVLYHLADPVAHLRALAPRVRRALMLDTHVATAERATDEFISDGRRFACHRYREGGRDEVFSGMRDHAKWLLLDDLRAVLLESGFTAVEVLEHRDERNGPRVLLFAEKRAG